MVRSSRWTLALLLCGAAVVLGPGLTATAAPAASAGLGTVIADLGTVTPFSSPGFSFDGAYYGYVVPTGDQCDVRLYDVRRREPVDLTHTRVTCYETKVEWAAHADTLGWQVDGADGDVSEYVWDADPGTVAVVAADARQFDQDVEWEQPSISADGRFVAFTGASDTHPAPAVDPARNAWYVYDRSTGVSLPLSRPDLHVQFTEWAPRGRNFVAGTGDQGFGSRSGTCFGSGASCRVFSDDEYFGGHWSDDGTAVLGFEEVVYDFTDDLMTPFPRRLGSVEGQFVGNDLIVGSLENGGFAWNRRTGKVTTVSSPSAPEASPNGRYLLFHQGHPDAYRYLNVETGAAAPATYRGTSVSYQPNGYWTKNGSSYLGVGPGGCSSLRQWSPATNTVSLFGPPGPRTCFSVPSPRVTSTFDAAFKTFSSASGRFALLTKRSGSDAQDYVVDLRRHVLLGPLEGEAQAFAPSGTDVLAVARQPGGGTTRMLLVDPTPVPDVDDKPRWSAATPATGNRISAEVGETVHLELGASDRQQTPVNLYFRWRTTAGTPVASAPKGWSCDRKRLAAGATVADCTFAPPPDHAATRFLDVWAVNHATGAQSDTRSYRVKAR